MSSSRSSALNNSAYFAGGALVGAGLYTLARSVVGQKLGALAGGPVAAASDAATKAAKDAAILSVPDEFKDSKGMFLAPIEKSDPLYDQYGAMGIPYEARAQAAPASELLTRMSLNSAQDVALAHDSLVSSLDKPMLINTLLAIEMLAFANSGVVFSYESHASGGFGAYCEERENVNSKYESQRTGPKVYAMQARAGAGNTIAGYLAGEGSTATVGDGNAHVTVLTNAPGFQAMGPALCGITSDRRNGLVIHVSSASQTTSDDLTVTNDYAATLATAGLLADVGFEIVLSSTRAEAIEFTQYAYTRKESKPIVHIFDGAYSGCEQGRATVPGAKAKAIESVEPFAYTGPSSPTTVLVLPNGSMALHARVLLISLPATLRSKIGVVSVRQLAPWDASSFQSVVPKSVSVVRVVEEAYTALGGALYTELLSSSLTGGLGTKPPVIQSVALRPGQELSSNAWQELLRAAAASSDPIDVHAAIHSDKPADLVDLLALTSSSLITFFGGDKGVTVGAPPVLADALFRENAKLHIRLLSRFDNFHASGSVRSDLVLSEKADTEIPIPVLAGAGSSHLVVISDPNVLLKEFALFDTVRPNGTVVLNAAGWTSEDVESALWAVDKKLLAERNVSLYVIDARGIAEALVQEAVDAGKGKGPVSPETALAPAVLIAGAVHAVENSPKNTLSSRLPKLVKTHTLADPKLASEAEKGTKAVSTAGWAEASPATEEEEKGLHRATHWAYNGFSANTSEPATDTNLTVYRASWAFAAWQMLFSEAYRLDDHVLRPDLPEKTYKVKVSVNKRLTPMEYDRNLFHIEFDTAGTGLTYEVGEALGVYGWNDDEEVESFLRWSGYSPGEIVSAPIVTNPSKFESRTVYQVLQQVLDIFGKPPKSFYEALGKVVASKDEERWLRFISSAEGSSTFKKLSENETVTYVDVLHMFPTARVTMDWLIENVEPIKPRHYSIASAQAAVGDSVHLLIVTVDWMTPRGASRYGQCTRYLSRLEPGAEVTVSIKPSVMKLPPLETQPIIMAGLGTGAAPFRAFLQARAHQRAQGKKVGPLYYYFGSRHQAKEYLYGEELEAYLSDGLLTHLGLAFSRDQKEKVYIQHKIHEDGHQLTSFLAPEMDAGSDDVPDGDKGIFTLCGPVWPVPDIQEALVSAFVERGWTKEQAESKLEQLKEDERYVLEVY